MANDQGAYPKLGATFTPGGLDDFYMPEVVSPAPQRYVDAIECIRGQDLIGPAQDHARDARQHPE